MLSAEEALVSETIDALLYDMLAWLAREARPYDEVMEAWRTSCPKLPVWEDANERGLVEEASANGRLLVRLTPAGISLLKEQRSENCPERLTHRRVNE